MFFNKGIAGANSSFLPMDWQEVTLLFKGIGKILPGHTRRLAGFYSSLRRKCQDYIFLYKVMAGITYYSLPQDFQGYTLSFPGICRILRFPSKGAGH